MTAVKSLAKLAQVSQALALTGKNLELIKKKKRTTKDLLGLGVTNIIGIGLISETGKIISGL